MAPKSLCLTTAFTPVPTFLGGSCPLGCSLSAPATGGFSVVSPQYIRYAAGSEKEKRARGPLHGDTIAQSFVFCKGAVSGWRGWSCFGLRPPSAESLAWPAPLSRPLHPPTFWVQGGLPLYPRRGLRPLHPAWETGASLRWRVWALPRLPCSQGQGQSRTPPGDARCRR